MFVAAPNGKYLLHWVAIHFCLGTDHQKSGRWGGRILACMIFFCPSLVQQFFFMAYPLHDFFLAKIGIVNTFKKHCTNLFLYPPLPHHFSNGPSLNLFTAKGESLKPDFQILTRTHQMKPKSVTTQIKAKLSTRTFQW